MELARLCAELAKAKKELSMMCEHLEVSSSGYHQHAQRTANYKPRKNVRREVSDDALSAHVKAIQAQVKGE